MTNFCRKHDGAIAVFLTLILIPTFLFGGVMVDGSRILASKNLISEAGDLAMNAALSNYHEQLNAAYGLLAMADTAQEVESIMKDCFEMSLNACGVSNEDFSKALVYLELTEGGFHASDLVDTEIYQTEVFKQEVLEYMKYRAPVTLVSRAMEGKVDELKTIEEEKAAADAQLKFEKDLNDIQNLLDELNELADKQVIYVNDIGTKPYLNGLVTDTNQNYEKITLLAVSYYRLTHSTDSASGEMKSLMEEMVDLSCDVSDITPDTASHLIKMKRIANFMIGRNTQTLLDDLDADSEEYSQTEQLISDYENAQENMEEGIEIIGRELDRLVEESYSALHVQREYAREGSECCTQAVDKLNEIKDALEDSKGKYENWKAAVDNLSNASSKSAYQESIDEVSGLFENNGIIADYEAKTIQNRVYFDDVLGLLDEVTFTDSRVDYEIFSKEVFMGEADYGQIIESGEVSSAASSFMGRYHTVDMSSLSGEIDLTVDERDPFIKKLKESYCNTDSANESEANVQAASWKTKLTTKIDQLNTLLTTPDIEDLNVRDIAGNELPSVWLGIAAEGDYAGSPVQADGSLDDKASRKKAAENGSKNLNQENASLLQMASLSSMMGKFAESALEPLYCTEYVMGMFSYYTVNRGRDGSEIADPMSLSRAALKKDELYRAEVEYILWGSPSVKSNINKTKAILFAANFVFNMSFAFTDSDMGSQARTIAAFFPVGMVGRTAIKGALLTIAATVETVDNVIDLVVEGKATPLIKKKNKWNNWLLYRPVPYDDSGSGFTYEDYLWILVCVNMYVPSQQTKLLGRAADCIELNLTEKKSKPENTLKDMHTMVSMDATLYIDTFFLQKLGGAGYDVSYDREAFKVDYHGIQGY